MAFQTSAADSIAIKQAGNRGKTASAVVSIAGHVAARQRLSTDCSTMQKCINMQRDGPSTAAKQESSVALMQIFAGKSGEIQARGHGESYE